MEELQSFDLDAIMIAATNGNLNCSDDPVYRQCIGNAIRAVADQVAPACDALSESGTKQLIIRHRLLNIAHQLSSEHKPEPNSSPLTDNQVISAASKAGLCYPSCWDFTDHPERLEHLHNFAKNIISEFEGAS
jgi:hypothetical protein